MPRHATGGPRRAHASQAWGSPSAASRPVTAGTHLSLRNLQVGFIANLRSIKSHTIVQQVSPASASPPHAAAPGRRRPPTSPTRPPATVPAATNLPGSLWSQALTALGCMEHRGACSADDDSGDGAGLMTQVPWKLLKKEMPAINEATCG